ncbi:hypothetical protein TAL182_PC00413 (plasmid) [Rhizobium sp. TAL182]|jgi:hypothetical protein|nr:hypothetical protein TAL182_PC00413 [Rhizobium sp. TAL182]
MVGVAIPFPQRFPTHVNRMQRPHNLCRFAKTIDLAIKVTIGREPRPIDDCKMMQWADRTLMLALHSKATHLTPLHHWRAIDDLISVKMLV